jgi:uncharacterized protein YbcV (DUF1398 family)
MDAPTVVEAAEASLQGTLPFPEIVSRLVTAGVEYYLVDYAAKRMAFYSAEGEAVTIAIGFDNLPPIAADFDAPALRAAILDSQQNGQKFREFTRRAMEAGVQSYFAFLRGQRVTYLGRQGAQHIEWFPGATGRPAGQD